MNALIAQKPQSCGASMWYRTLDRLHTSGMNTTGSLVFCGSYEALTRINPNDITVVTGTYDSFLVQTPTARVDDVIQWLTWTMEQPWPQLGGLRIPVDVSVGSNWRDYDERDNPDGIREREYKAFSADRP